MAAPVGHIVCALALLHSNVIKIIEPEAFLAGTSFSDIRYVAPIERKVTHRLAEDSLLYAMKTDSDFEKGRRFHAWVDHRRETYMREQKAYRFVKDEPMPTHMLKLIEDHILFPRLKGHFDPHAVFQNIYPEERAYKIPDADIKAWHSILTRYLDQDSWFNAWRYYRAFSEFRKSYGLSQGFFQDLWTSIRSFAFVIYAYVKIEQLSRNEELRHIILNFYENKIEELIKNAGKMPLSKKAS